MRAWMAPLEELGEYSLIRDYFKKGAGTVSLGGCTDAQKLHMLYGTGESFRLKLIVTYDELRAKQLCEDASLYSRNVYYLPTKDLIFYQADIHGSRLTTERMRVLKKLCEGTPVTVVMTYGGLVNRQTPKEVILDSRMELRKNREIDMTLLSQKLVNAGYEKTFQVERPGEFSVRGGIVDIFDMTEDNPFRIEFWGDEIETIKSFDVESQRSIEELSGVTIYPATELPLDEKTIRSGIGKIRAEYEKQHDSFRREFHTEEAHHLKLQTEQLLEELEETRALVNLDSYLPYFFDETRSMLQWFDSEKTLVCMDEPSRIEEAAKATEAEFAESMLARCEKGYLLPGQMKLQMTLAKAHADLSSYRVMTVAALERKGGLFKPDKSFVLDTRSVAPYNNSFETLLKDLKKYKKEGYRVLLLCGLKSRAARLASDLFEEELNAYFSEDPSKEIKPGEIMLTHGHVSRGFEYPLIKFVVIAESDVFGVRNRKKRTVKKYEGQKIHDFTELNVGDYVVHESHGLGIYRGIEKVEVEHVIKDYMKIEYRNGGNLYIPATNFYAVQKYAAADAKPPKLNKLGSVEWTNTKARVRLAVDEVAKDLVELYAARMKKKGFAFEPDTPWQRDFEDTFPFEETQDQLTAIRETKADMESDRIMDRLICGDVGYGKTEIAIRAAFKAVQSGKQVVFLVPTTILAQQHYNTFSQRIKDFPMRVDLMSRFRTPAQQKQTLADLKNGLVDIVIGTHRVLSKDLQFKDLGLLIIDEEQRFGVTHKEKLKKMKADVDVLTLTATPIPRTLHMSLVGIRDMSVLEEPPGERMPVQTYVMEYNEEMVREAIARELSRDGQVYYVYNRVNSIADITAKLQQLVPDAVIAYAHGQMKERDLENILYDFISGNIDVLVSTTIIETGMDIPNVNTMIIHDSDNMGLAQLYQLRGRVGRSNRTAYAFLMYKRDKLIKEVAEKRLAAIREFTDLGSGFKIAMRDLEIRGAGNLLGKMQHGHMEAVGYDLYCKMLNEAVKTLKGESVEEDFETAVELDVDAYIPREYILNEVQKLDVYKRIASVETVAEMEDMKDELLDRFGQVPAPVENLLRIALLRKRAHDIYFSEIKGKNGLLKFTFYKDAKIRVENIPELVMNQKGKLKFETRGIPAFSCSYGVSGITEKDGEKLLALTEEMLETFTEYLKNE